MEGLPSDVISLIREYLSPTFNSMLSLSCKKFFDKEGKHRIYGVDATVSIPLIQYIYRGVPEKPSVFAHAARNGNINILCWLKENGAPWDERVYSYAAKRGNSHTLQWLKENGAPLNMDRAACRRAAEAGNLYMLQWLRENGVPWDSWTCMYAARMGHLHVLRWMKENGAPWDRVTCKQVVRRSRHHDVLAWLENQ